MIEKVKGKRNSSLGGALKRYRMLESALGNPKRAKAELVESCESQGKLAALMQPDVGVHAMSLNTLKRLANEEISNGGWAELDRARRELYRWYRKQRNRQPVRPKNTREQLKEKLAALEGKVEQLHRGRAVLIRAYSELLGIAQKAAKTDQQTQLKLDRHRVAFGEVGIHALYKRSAND